MKKKDMTDWHHILQDILDQHLELMSGKRIVHTEWEKHQVIKADYFCKTAAGEPETNSIPGIRPFDHLLEYNIIEYKSIHETINDCVFLQYVARALHNSGALGTVDEQSKVGIPAQVALTLVVTREPKRLLANKTYQWETLTPWKRRCFIWHIPVYVLIQKNMRGIQGGEPMAYLQVLEGNEKRQNETWSEIFEQDLSSANALKRIMMKINREVYMNFLEQVRKEAIDDVRPLILKEGVRIGKKEGVRIGKKEGVRIGKKEGVKIGELKGMKHLLLSMIEDFAPELLPKYKPRILAVQTIEAFLGLKGEVYKDMGSLR